MKEFVKKLIGRLKSKHIPYLSMDNSIPYGTEMIKLFDAISIINQLVEEMGVSKMENTTWIPYATNEELPTNGQKVWLSFTTEYTSFVKSAYWIYDHFEWANGKKVKDFPSAWKPYETPAPYQKGYQK